MIEIAELLEPGPQPWWRHLKQVGVDKVVSLLGEGGEQGRRWLRSMARGGPGLVDQRAGAERPWTYEGLKRIQESYAEHGLELVALEDTPPMDLVRLGRPGRDEQIEWFQDQLRAMGRLGIPVACYNWLAVGSWARTDVARPTRGGALTTAYDRGVGEGQEPMLEPGEVTAEQLWQNLEYFLKAAVPVAEEAGVALGMHPDDPPVESVRGVPRIMNSPAAYDRLLELVPSPANGVTLCQGNFALMTDDLPGTIRHFGPSIKFVHFRDVAGSADRFEETFHDQGPTDLVACLEAYRDAGFDGVLRPDHVPTLSGESNDKPGYAVLARLHAVGYIAGLRRAVYGRD